MSGVICCFKQKTAYEMRISDWSSDVCSSDLLPVPSQLVMRTVAKIAIEQGDPLPGVVAERFGIVPVRFKAIVMRCHSDCGIAFLTPAVDLRSEERRVGKGCGSTWRSRW